MLTKLIDTEEKAQDFVKYINEKGGRVVKIYALRQGFQFDIIKPDNVEYDPTWGKKMLDNYLSGKV